MKPLGVDQTLRIQHPFRSMWRTVAACPMAAAKR
jgi:hypothetical protein